MAGRPLVEEVLQDRGVEHSETSHQEPGIDTLDGREVDVPTTEGGVDGVVEDGNQNLQGRKSRR